MPPSGNRDFTIVVTVSPDQARAVLGLAGDVDTEAWPELTDVIQRLAAAPPDIIVVDLAAVTFVGSVLPNFLARLRQVVPATTELTVSRPTRSARFILRVTDAAQFAKTADALPG